MAPKFFSLSVMDAWDVHLELVSSSLPADWSHSETAADSSAGQHNLISLLFQAFAGTRCLGEEVHSERLHRNSAVFSQVEKHKWYALLPLN